MRIVQLRVKNKNRRIATHFLNQANLKSASDHSASMEADHEM